MAGAFITVPAQCGMVRGRILDSGIEEYLGIPYAKAERFCKPKAYSWDGMRQCLNYGPKAMQPSRCGEIPEGEEIKILGSEDCLNLNVWVQPGTVARMLPVVVYIHGGGFQEGSNSEKGRDGASFIQNTPLVFVSVNYRLGALGFTQLGEEMGEKYRYSANCGVLDVLEAMRWVNRNIEAFGGDPKNVTMMGISAGAKMIGSMMTIPELQDLCQRVILESGGMQSFRDKGTARSIALDWEKEILRLKGAEMAAEQSAYGSGVHPQQAKAATAATEPAKLDEKELLTMPAEMLVRAQAALCNAPGTTCYYGPVLDGNIFPANWLGRCLDGKGWKGRVVLGSCRREMANMAERPDFEERKEEILYNLFGDQGHIAQEKFDELEAIVPRGTENWVKVLSDFMYRHYTDSVAKRLAAKGCRVWVYSFDYGAATHGMGFHTMMDAVEQLPPSDDPETMKYRRMASYMRTMIRRFLLAGRTEEPERWGEFKSSSGYLKLIIDEHPHLESRPRDTLDGFPVQVFHREKKEEA